jgi:sugar phosphate isomerase/epimerase
MVMYFCADLDVKCLTVHTGGHSLIGIEQLRRSLDELTPQAQELGISICLENTATDRLGWLFLEPEQCLELCQQTGCQVTLDMIHLWCSHLEPWKTIQQLLPYAGNVHIADTLGDHHFHLPLGFGNLPIDQILEVLANSGYSGKVVVDAVHKDYEFSLYLKQAQFYRERLLTS